VTGADSTRGILYPARLPTFTRLAPPVELAGLVRWYWIPEWDLEPGRVSRQHLVAYPAFNLAVEKSLVGLSGPSTRASYRDLFGRGWAVGALLRPAAVPAFTDDPSGLRDRYVPLDAPDLHAAVCAAMAGPPMAGTASLPPTASADAEAARLGAVAAVGEWLTLQIPEVSEEGRLANELAEVIESDAEIRQLADVAERLSVSVRTVQRLAKRYVGLSPGAMIRRRRLQEAAARIRSGDDVDLAGLAADLGYADHAHLSREFQTVLGFTPSAYRRTT